MRKCVKVCRLLFGDQSETEFRVETTHLEGVHFVLLQMRGRPHDASQRTSDKSLLLFPPLLAHDASDSSAPD